MKILRALCLWLLATAGLYLCSAVVLALFGVNSVWISALPTTLLAEAILFVFHLFTRRRRK